MLRPRLVPECVGLSRQWHSVHSYRDDVQHVIFYACAVAEASRTSNAELAKASENVLSALVGVYSILDDYVPALVDRPYRTVRRTRPGCCCVEDQSISLLPVVVRSDVSAVYLSRLPIRTLAEDRVIHPKKARNDRYSDCRGRGRKTDSHSDTAKLT